MLDLEALKAKLAEYDPAAPKCPLQITRHRTDLDFYEDYDMITYVPCCRPEGHEGECRNARPVMGWPDFQTVSQLVAEVERLREMLLNAGWPRESEELAALALQYERAAVVAWLKRMAGNARHWGGDDNTRAEIYDNLVDVFECGEHRKED